jgi:hypothetical protein
MTIKVELVDGTLCRVVPRGLDLLLSRHLVRRFQRESGWAVVGHDPVRRSSERPQYAGPERRIRFGVN